MCRTVLHHINSIVCEARFQCQPLAKDSFGCGKNKERPNHVLGQADVSFLSFQSQLSPPVPSSFNSHILILKS